MSSAWWAIEGAVLGAVWLVLASIVGVFLAWRFGTRR